jgi:hypothetical protein
MTAKDRNRIIKTKRAELASAVGAGLAGAGIGVLAAQVLAQYALAFLALGALLHGWGMLAKHRLESNLDLPAWSHALYWLCWIALAALAAWIALVAWR